MTSQTNSSTDFTFLVERGDKECRPLAPGKTGADKLQRATPTRREEWACRLFMVFVGLGGTGVVGAACTVFLLVVFFLTGSSIPLWLWIVGGASVGSFGLGCASAALSYRLDPPRLDEGLYPGYTRIHPESFGEPSSREFELVTRAVEVCRAIDSSQVFGKSQAEFGAGHPLWRLDPAAEARSVAHQAKQQYDVRREIEREADKATKLVSDRDEVTRARQSVVDRAQVRLDHLDTAYETLVDRVDRLDAIATDLKAVDADLKALAMLQEIDAETGTLDERLEAVVGHSLAVNELSAGNHQQVREDIAVLSERIKAQTELLRGNVIALIEHSGSDVRT